MFDSGVRNNFPGGTIALGRVAVQTPLGASASGNNAGAFQLYNLAVEAWQHMANHGDQLPKVLIEWPAASSAYILAVWPTVARFYIEDFDNAGRPVPFVEGVPFHEYGHHIMAYLYSVAHPIPNYNNGICGAGHCAWGPELGVVSWTEGWPDFFAATAIDVFNHDVDPVTRQDTETVNTCPSGSTPTAGTPSVRPRYSYENHFDCGFSGMEASIEGFIAAILWDIGESTGANDDQHNNGAGRRDQLNGTFDLIWKAMKNYDPFPQDPFRNHPASIFEFWDAIKATQPSFINAVSEIFAEHHLITPQPDLSVTALSNPPASARAGSVFTATSSVSNVGAETAFSGSVLQYYLAGVSSVGRTKLTSQRSVAGNFAAGATLQFTDTMVIPFTLAEGSYRLQACADDTRFVPEVNETNNCRSSILVLVVGDPDLGDNKPV